MADTVTAPLFTASWGATKVARQENAKTKSKPRALTVQGTELGLQRKGTEEKKGGGLWPAWMPPVSPMVLQKLRWSF